MKAIIPVAGAGTHLRPHTYTQPKALIPVAGKPILGFIIDQLIDAGLTDFVFVIGYLGEKIKAYVEEKYPNITAHFVVQENREGIGHAIWSAREMIEENEEVFIVLGDTIVEGDLKAMCELPHSALGVKRVENPTGFGVAEINADGFISKVVEKPRIPKSNLALVGVYRILESAMMFESLKELIEQGIRTREEFQLTDAIMAMIQKGAKFAPFKMDNWYDCGKKDVLLETNATLLKKLGMENKKLPEFENTIIIQPVHIGKGTRIQNSIIGPNVTIGENSDITDSIIRDSIIGDFANLVSVVLHNSGIGSDVYLKGPSQSLNIGDNTEMNLSGE